MEQFKKDVASEAVADAVARDRKQGEALDLQGTPSIFINGRLFPTGQDFEQDLEGWIKLELELVGGGASPAPSPAPAPSAVVPAPSAKPKSP
jgi:hypothetical protein